MARYTPDDAAPSAGGAGFTDTFSLSLGLVEANTAPTDDATFAIALGLTDTVDAQSETLGLGIFGLNDSTATPTDSNAFTMLVWLSASAGAGTTNPANADGQNDGTVATVTTAIAGSVTETLTSALGANVPTATLTSCVYRGWFNSVNVLTTSTGSVIVDYSGGAITMFTNSGLNTTVNYLDGSFSFDLFAAGVNTLAKAQSCTVRHTTTDAAAGVTPHVLTVDAGCLSIAGAF